MNVALIGLGSMGRMHAEAWKKMIPSRLIAACGKNHGKNKLFAEEFGIELYHEFEQVLQQSIDVVDICLPTYLHKEYVLKAAAAKKHIIVEKPLGLNVEEAQVMIDACKSNGVKLYVAHVLRFFPEYLEAHNQIKRGDIGTPGIVRLSRGGPYPQGLDVWYDDANKSGGLMLDLIIHDFDWLRWTFGEVKRVTAQKVYRKNKLYYALVVLRMSDGTIAHVEGSWAKSAFTTSFEITGDKGMIVHNNMSSVPIHQNFYGSQQMQAQPSEVLINHLHKNPYQRQLEHYISCILNDDEPMVTAHDALKAVEICRAAIESTTTGKPIDL